MLLIGITGQMRSGKGEIAGFIKDWASGEGLTAKERGFSDLLKWSAFRLFKPDCTMAEALVWQDGFKTKGEIRTNMYTVMGGREFLQRYGTESHREVFGQDFWVDSLLPLDDTDKLRSNFNNATIGIVSDLRFDNEAERIRELGGAVWQVERHLEQQDAHVSEKGINPDLISCRLDNSADLIQLRLKVEDQIAAEIEENKMQLRMQI